MVNGVDTGDWNDESIITLDPAARLPVEQEFIWDTEHD